MSLPNELMPVGLFGTGAVSTGYSISRSLRFNSADSAYLSRTPASAGNRKTWTWAGWVKRSRFGGTERFFIGGSTGAGGGIQLESDTLFAFDFPGSLAWSVQTSAVFRDPSSWYHIVLALDTTQATSSNRVKLYVNGSQQTALTSTYPTLNYEGYVNAGSTIHTISSLNGGSDFFSGYLADIHFIDGQALDPTSFGEFDATTGVWMPIEYTGTYGTNGFHLDFADNSSNTATTLGKDTSGNGNNWTPNNLSVTAGAGNDSLVDVPTNGAQTDTGAGGEVRGNYCTLNPLDQRFTDNGTISNGNLDYVQSSTGSRTARCTIGVSSGKWYWEFTHLGGNASHGISKASSSLGSFPGGADADGWSWFAGGNIYNNSASTATYAGLTYTTNDVIGLALDLDAGTLTYYKNGVSQGTAVSGLTGTWFPSFGSSGVVVVSITANFGQRPFAYTAPSGFKALNTANLPAPLITKPSDVMDVKLYTGNNSTQTIPLNFNPDFIWLKCRNSARSHRLIDTVRGLNYQLWSDLTTGGNTYDATSYVSSVTSTSSSGFVVDNSGSDQYNTSGETYVAWTWDAGSSTVTNTQGSITSQVRANATAGFSVVTYTGTGSSGATVGHGLNVAPQLLINKRRSGTGTTADWAVWHKSVADISGSSYVLFLNTTDAALSASNRFNSTAPTSSVFTLGNADATNYNGGTFVTYCFAPVAGYSAFGSYTGNGSTDGSFTYLGFLPKLILIKRTDTTSNWTMLDTLREGYNVDNDPLYPNLSDAEGTTDLLDITSNGFKLRSTDASVNASGGTYIFAAWASNPFQYSRAR